MTIKVKTINKIPTMVDEYIKKYGSTKTFMARKMGYNSRQAFDKAVKNVSNSVETYAKFASFFNCQITDLFETTVTFTDKQETKG